MAQRGGLCFSLHHIWFLRHLWLPFWQNLEISSASPFHNKLHFPARKKGSRNYSSKHGWHICYWLSLICVGRRLSTCLSFVSGSGSAVSSAVTPAARRPLTPLPPLPHPAISSFTKPLINPSLFPWHWKDAVFKPVRASSTEFSKEGMWAYGWIPFPVPPHWVFYIIFSNNNHSYRASSSSFLFVRASR